MNRTSLTRVRGSSFHALLETVKTVAAAIVIAVAVRSLAFEPFEIPSASMEPTLDVGDYIFISKFAYGYSRYSFPFGLPPFPGRILSRPPQRGDVAVFKLPRDNSTDYIKRIIGLPGDHIQVLNGILIINGVPVQRQRIEDYLFRQDGFAVRAAQYVEILPNGKRHRIIQLSDAGLLDNTPVFVVPPGHYFVMGDNRDDSADSRDPTSGVGFVPAANLEGPAEIIFFSIHLSHPSWEFWKWPSEIRYGRLFRVIE